MSKNKWGYSLLGLTSGVFIMAVGILSFLEPYNLAPGGTTGFSVAIKGLTGTPIYITNLILNVPLFILTLFILGKKFGWKTFYATSMLSVFLKVIPFNLPSPNMFVGAMIGGLFLGTGIGTVLSAGGTTGGTDLVAAMIKKYRPDVKIGNLMMLMDGTIIVFSGLVVRDINVAIFSALSMLFLTRTVDFILTKDLYRGFFLRE